MWAFGLVVYVLITDRFPFIPFANNDRFDDNKLRARIRELKNIQSELVSLPYTSHISEDDRLELHSVVNRLLEPDVSQRQSLEVIERDQWFRNRKRCDNYYIARPLT